jgi:N-methylhydantoinase B
VETRLGSKTTLELVPGDVVGVRTCGGGGYGPPEERDPQHVLRDVLQGKVSLERARDVYRVGIAGGEVDAAATGALRATA